jgi:uncharacterized protein YndB with AHSA1/START domain
MVKRILLALVVLVAAFAGYIALQPAEFRVERNAIIAAPAADVFQHVNDLHKWDAWSPWAKLDPKATVGFEGTPAGKDAVLTWSGNDSVGEGRMTILESRPTDHIAIKVDFTKPFEGSNSSEFTFRPEGSGTAVTWAMSGHQGFIEKAMCFVMNGKKMVGDEMAKGLAQLKSVAEANKG